jgi:hypothetical protein
VPYGQTTSSNCMSRSHCRSARLHKSWMWVAWRISLTAAPLTSAVQLPLHPGRQLWCMRDFPCVMCNTKLSMSSASATDKWRGLSSNRLVQLTCPSGSSSLQATSSGQMAFILARNASGHAADQAWCLPSHSQRSPEVFLGRAVAASPRTICAHAQ